MLMKKQVPYKLRKGFLKLALFASPLLFTISCDKEEPINPLKQKIEELTTRSEIEEKELRVATTAALTEPYDIREWYWDIFRFASKKRPAPAQNFLDSAKVHMLTLEVIYDTYGRPVPVPNDENIGIFYIKAGTYLATMAELDSLKTKVK